MADNKCPVHPDSAAADYRQRVLPLLQLATIFEDAYNEHGRDRNRNRPNGRDWLKDVPCGAAWYDEPARVLFAVIEGFHAAGEELAARAEAWAYAEWEPQTAEPSEVAP